MGDIKKYFIEFSDAQFAATVVVLVVIVIIIVFKRSQKKQFYPVCSIPVSAVCADTPIIPQNVYMFWEGKTTALVTACEHRLRCMNPSWSVHVMELNDIGCKPPGFDSLSIQHKSDWARVYVLSRKGGVWLDATCIQLQPLESWVDRYSNTVQGFNVPFDCKIMENWAFATPPNHPVMVAWCREFELAIQIGFKSYNKTRTIPPCLNNWLPYLTMHQCFDAIDTSDIHTRSSTDETGPYGLATLGDNGTLNSILKDIAYLHHSWKMPFIKLNGDMVRSLDKKTINKLVHFCLSCPLSKNFL